jgi:site-specific recombinase XerD
MVRNTFLKYYDLFINELKEDSNLANSTKQRYIECLVMFKQYVLINSIDITKINSVENAKNLIDTIKNKQGKSYSHSTKQIISKAVSKFFQFLKLKNKIKTNVFKVVNIKIPNHQKLLKMDTKLLNPDELRMILSYTKKHHYYLYQAILMLYCFGLRISELGKINKECFEKKGDLIKLKVKNSKGKGIRYTYCIFKEYNKEIWEILQSFNFTKVNINSIKTQIQHLKKKLNIKSNLQSHTFRCQFGVEAIRRGISINVLKSLYNHSNIQTTMIYLKLSNLDVERQLQSL